MNIGTLTVSLGVDSTGLIAAQDAMTRFEKSVTTSLNTSAQRFRTFGYLASATITASMVLAGKASMKMASDFEFSMQKIVGLAGVAQDSVTKWNEELMKMAPEVAKGPKELAEALYFISSSGIKGAEAIDVLRISAKAASAGLGQTQDVANLLTSALNAYAGTGLTAAKAADILVAAVREGKAEADAFANSIGQIIPIAANLGVSFDQVAGGMAAITLSGASAANASVYLKGIFNSLVTASSQGEKALNLMGSSYSQLRSVLKEQGLIALMQKLRDLQVKYGDELMGDVLPNIRAMTGYLSIAGKNFKYNSELMQRVTNSTGSLGKAFAAVADTLKVRMDVALASANVSMIKLGKNIAEAAIPILEKLVKGLENLAKWFDSLTEAEKRHKLIFAAFVAAIGPATLLINVMMYSASGLWTIITKLGKGFVFLSQELVITKTVMGAVNAEVALTTINTVRFATALSGIGIVVAMAWPIIQKLIDKIKDLKMQIAEAESTLHYTDTAMGLDVSIGKRISVLKTLTQEQLQVLANDIKERRRLEEEKLLLARTTGLKEIEQEVQVLKWKQEIADKEANLAHLKKTEAYDSADVERWTQATKYYVEERKQLISDYIKDRKNEVAYDKVATQDTINFYNKQFAAVDALIIKQIFLTEEVKKTTKAYGKLITKIGKMGIPSVQIPKDKSFTTNNAYSKASLTPDFVSEFKNIMGTGYQGLAEAPVMPDIIQSANNALMRQQNILNSLTNSFSNMFQSVGGGFKGMVDTMLQELGRLVSYYLAKAAILGLITLLFPGTSLAVAALGVLKNSASFFGVGHAGGNFTVPPGFPNDSYPARLSSGETVLTPGQLAGVSASNNIHLEVDEIRLEQRALVVLLRRSGMYN